MKVLLRINCADKKKKVAVLILILAFLFTVCNGLDFFSVKVTRAAETEYNPDEAKYDGSRNYDADSSNDPGSWTDSNAVPELTDDLNSTQYEVREDGNDKWFYVKYNADANQYSSVKIKIKIDSWDSTFRNYKFEIRAYSTLTTINTSAEAKVVSSLCSGTDTRTWYTVDVTTAAHTMDGKGWMKFRVWLNEYNGSGNDRGYASECRFLLTKETLTASHTPPTAANINQGTTDTVIDVLNLSADTGSTITVNSIKVDRTGTSSDSDVSLVKLIDDANGNGLYDGGEATLASGTFSSGTKTFTLTSYTVTGGTPRKILVVYDISSSATHNATVGSNLVDNSYISVASPATVSSSNFPLTSNTFTIKDVTAPTTTLTTNPSSPDGANGWFKTTPSITLTRDEPGATYYQWDGTAGPWTTYSTSFTAPEGQHTLYYYSVDSANNTETTKNQAFKVDTTPPTSAITDPTANAYIGGSKAIIGTATDTNFQRYDLEYGAGASPTIWYAIGTNPHTVAVSNGTLDTWDTTTVSDGQYTIRVTTTDLAGNTSSASVTVTVDNTPPTVASVDPANGSVGVANAANIYATFSESMTASTINTTTFTLYDSTAGSSVGGTVTYDNTTKKATFDPTSDLITDHNYTATITTGVKDLAGQNMASNYVWSFSTRPPQIPSGLSVKSGDLKNKLTWNLNPEPNVKYKIYRSTTETGTYTLIHTTNVGETSYNDTGYGTKGYYWYKISAVDAGTLNESSKCAAQQNSLVAMSESVVAANGDILDASNAEANFSIPAGALSADATVTVDETTTPPGGSTLASSAYEIQLGSATLSTNATITLKYDTGFDTSSLYIERWNPTESKWDYVGGTVNEETQTILVGSTDFGAGKYYAVASDTTAPTAPSGLTAIQGAGTSIDLSWTAASDPESSIHHYIVYRYTSAINESNKSLAQVLSNSVSDTAYNDSTGIPGETYYYAVSAVNGAQLEGSVSNSPSQTVAVTEDPHRSYSDATNLCRDCHRTHGAPSGAKIILRKVEEIDICYVCHDGTGSIYNIQTTYQNLSAHDTQVSAPTISDIKCMNCHYPHGTGSSFMVRLPEESQCFNDGCHDNVAHTRTTTILSWNIYSQFQLASRHAITGTTGDGLTGAKVECSSCHGPHTVKYSATSLEKVSDPDNTYKLANASGTGISIMSNFCLKCHDGTAPAQTWGSAVTFVPYTIAFPSVASYPFFTGWSKATFTTAGHYTTTGTKAYCETCHHPHGSSNARLTAYNYNNTSTYVEENLCYACHGTTPASGADNIQSQAIKTYRHPVGDYTGRHSDTETASGFGTTNRHAECVDCHDPHKATSVTHSAGTSTASGALTGVIGVEPPSTAEWQVPDQNSYTIVNPAQYEYQICFKCHSSFAYGSSPPSGQTDQAKEFNPNNTSYHGVMAVPSDVYSGASYRSPWTYNSRMYCSDCHGSNTSGDPKGPHGSNLQHVLRGTWNHGHITYKSGYSGSLCDQCHNIGSSSTGFKDGTSNEHTSDHDGEYCISCHSRVPHGINNNHLWVFGDDPAPYKDSSFAGRSTAWPHRTPGNWGKDYCHNVSMPCK